LDLLRKFPIALTHKVSDQPRSPIPSTPANPLYVIHRSLGVVELDQVLDVLRIEAARGKIIAHHDWKFSGLEQIQGRVTHLSRHFAVIVEWQILDVFGTQKVANSINFCPLFTKYECLVGWIDEFSKFLHVVFIYVQILDLKMRRYFVSLIAFDY